MGALACTRRVREVHFADELLPSEALELAIAQVMSTLQQLNAAEVVRKNETIAFTSGLLNSRMNPLSSISSGEVCVLMDRVSSRLSLRFRLCFDRAFWLASCAALGWVIIVLIRGRVSEYVYMPIGLFVSYGWLLGGSMIMGAIWLPWYIASDVRERLISASIRLGAGRVDIG